MHLIFFIINMATEVVAALNLRLHGVVACWRLRYSGGTPSSLQKVVCGLVTSIPYPYQKTAKLHTHPCQVTVSRLTPRPRHRTGAARRLYSALFLGLFAISLALLGANGASAREWTSLAKDRIHDPAGPAIGQLQEPGQALSVLPPDTAGNQVRWVPALEDGYISPRTNILPETKVNVLDLDVIMKRTSQMFYVKFPHKPHTEWLDCSQCHEKLFRSKAGETPLNMMMILMGEKCGQCHGAVAFPLTECARCHSVPWDDKMRGPINGVPSYTTTNDKQRVPAK